MEKIDLLPEEQIKQIKNFPKYYISSLGRVWSTFSHKWLIPTISQRGNHKREYVSLGRGNKFYIHQLVANAFIDNPNNYKEIDHIDTNGLNNRVENLRWVNHQQNMDNNQTQQNLKTNTGFFVEIEEISTGKLFCGYEELSAYTGLSKSALQNHTKNRVKNPKWKLTGKRINPNLTRQNEQSMIE